MRAAFRPPPQAMVYALGDSITRESISSDSAWTRQLRNRAGAAGKAVPAAFTLAGHNQTFGMDGQLVAAIPPRRAGQPRGIVLIGVGLSRFIGPPDKQTPVDLGPPDADVRPQLSSWRRHLYDGRRPLSLSYKRQLMRRWMERRWAGFAADRRANLAALTRVIKACKAKGLRPVILDQPLDRKLVGSRLRRPRLSIRNGCSALASK